MRPTALPKIRAQVLRHLENPEASLRAKTSADMQPGLDAAASHFRVAELYWAAPDMTALAVSAGAQLAAARWATADRPAPCGLIVFEGGVGMMPSYGVDIPIDAISWGPHDGHCVLWLWVNRRRVEDALAVRGAELLPGGTPPLVPAYGFGIPVGAEPVSMAELDGQAPQPVVAALAAAWLLMQQPTLVERRSERPDKATARAYGRLGQPSPDVTVVDLRRAYALDAREEDGTQLDGRRYRHRWVVQGHWRDQPYGPERAMRRKTWIPAHIKGPDGAPMLATERVNVWRR